MQKSQIIKELHNTITSDDILGKDVIDPAGEFIGIVEQIHVDPKSVDVLGISIDKGFLKKGLVIGKHYIERITPYAVFINIRPAFNLKGMVVYDATGVKVGMIADIKLIGNTNQLDSMVVRTGLRSHVRAEAKDIDRVGYNVFLKVQESELKRI